ncbi:hypothetical protein F5Y08DRAFT_310816, partial [Xylaria arbuscula]
MTIMTRVLLRWWGIIFEPRVSAIFPILLLVLGFLRRRLTTFLFRPLIIGLISFGRWIRKSEPM